MIPFEMAFSYLIPGQEKVPLCRLVDVTSVPHELIEGVETVADGIELYISLRLQQFGSQDVAQRIRGRLRRFAQYLEQQGHSMQLADLTLADGQEFVDAVRNPWNGEVLSTPIRQRYQAALRVWGRFLFQVGLVEEDLFWGMET